MPRAAPIFDWDDAKAHLSKRDKVLRKLIRKYPDADLGTRGDAFQTLARSIVGQQISVKAAQAMWDRFAKLPRKMTPANVLKLKVDDMQAALGAVRRGGGEILPGSASAPRAPESGRAPSTGSARG